MDNFSRFISGNNFTHVSDIETALQLEQIHKQRFFQRLAGIFLIVIPVLAIIGTLSNWFYGHPLIDIKSMLILSLLFLATLSSLYLNSRDLYQIAVTIFLAVSVISLTLSTNIFAFMEFNLLYFSFILIIGKPLLGKRGLFFLMLWMVAIVLITSALDFYPAPISPARLILFIASSYAVLFIISLFRDDLEAERRDLLKRNDDRLKWLIHQLPAIIWTVDDKEGAKVLPSAYSSKLADFNFENFAYSVETTEQIRQAQVSNMNVDFEYSENNYVYYTQLESLRDRNGRIIGCIGITTDITLQKIQSRYEWDSNLERERIEILRDFLSTASHDLRTPLSSLNLSTYLLSQSGLNEKQTQHLNHVLESTNRFTDAMDKMFMVLRLRLDNEAMEETPYDIVSMTSSLVQGFEKPYIKIDTLFDVPSAYIYGNEKLMATALTNIFQNAVDNIDEAGTISVYLKKEKEEVLIEIRDTGCGIPEAELAKVTNAFYRVAKHRPGNRVGLGLTISKNIIEKHKGVLAIQSTVGVGTYVSIRLPIKSMRYGV